MTDLIARLREAAISSCDSLFDLAADALEAAARQRQTLTAEIEQWRTWGVIEIAIRNCNVRSYMNEWEERAAKALGGEKKND